MLPIAIISDSYISHVLLTRCNEYMQNALQNTCFMGHGQCNTNIWRLFSTIEIQLERR